VNEAAAQPEMTTIAVDYKPGAKYRFTPKEFNYTETSFVPYSGTKIEHFEKAAEGTASASIRSKKTQSGHSWAALGIMLNLNLPSRGTFSKYSGWDYINKRPYELTITVSYDIEAKGNQDTNAFVAWGAFMMYVPTWNAHDDVTGNAPVHAQRAVTTLTLQGKVGDFFMWDNLMGWVMTSAAAAQDSAGEGQASASIFCSSIELEFPFLRSSTLKRGLSTMREI
jgi:hypothetical protein